MIFNTGSAETTHFAIYILTFQAAVDPVQPVSADVCFKMCININNRMQFIWRKKWPLWGLKAMMYTATFCDKAHRAIIVLYVMSECFKCGQTEGGLDDRSKAVSDVSVL